MSRIPLLILTIFAAALAPVGAAQHASAPLVEKPEGVETWRPVATFSIVARDGRTGQLGVAVQTHWFSVGTVVPWAESGVGAVATQALSDITYGPLGLAMMRAGRTPEQTLAGLTEADPGSAYRQVGMIDGEGNVAAHTGSLVIAEAGHVTRTLSDGTVISCQANMMHRAGVPEAMANAMERLADSRMEFPMRLASALLAAQAAGGDVRGMQSAAILVVRAETTGAPWEDRLVDLRVEDHQQPVSELVRLLKLHAAYEHMNAGDVAIEHGDVEKALHEYRSALELSPGDSEMAFWTGVSLANAGIIDESISYFRTAFSDPDERADWRALLRRLPDSKLFTDDDELINRILREASPAN